MNNGAVKNKDCSNAASSTTPRIVGRPFAKGDPRINRKGRIKTFCQFRQIAQEIASRTVTTLDGRQIKKAEELLERWSNSDEPILQKAFAAYAFGNVPDKLETTGLDGAPLRPMVIQVITAAVAAALPLPDPITAITERNHQTALVEQS